MKRLLFLLQLCVAYWPLMGQEVQDTSSQVVDIDHADLYEIVNGDDQIQKLTGHVAFSQDTTNMYCDTAVIKNEKDVFALGNIYIRQGDSIHVYSDSLFYSAVSKIADLYGEVILTTGEKSLFTDHLEYDMNAKLGTYTTGALLTDGETQLRSKRGFYFVDEHKIYFKDSVIVVGEHFSVKADTLIFNTETHIVDFTGPTLMTNQDNRVYCEAGYYDTKSDYGIFRENAQFIDGEQKGRAEEIIYDGGNKEYVLSGHALYEKGGREAKGDVIRYDAANERVFLMGNAYFKDSTRLIVADTIIYDSEKGTYTTKGRAIIHDGEKILKAEQIDFDEESGTGLASGSVVWQDTVEQVSILCNTAEYRQEDSYLKASGGSFGRPLMVSMVDGDSLYIAADTLYSYEETDSTAVDTFRVLQAFHDVRLFKSDMQALCDSLVYHSRDSLFYFYDNPIMWSDTSQFVADTMSMRLANNNLEKVFLKRDAFILNSPDEIYFNQVKGKNITASFDSSELRRMYVIGNAETVYYVIDEEGAYVGVNTTKCSEMELYFYHNTVEKIKFFTQPQSEMIPMSKANHEQLKLKGFKWEKDIRPKSISDLFGERKGRMRTGADVEGIIEGKRPKGKLKGGRE